MNWHLCALAVAINRGSGGAPGTQAKMITLCNHPRDIQPEIAVMDDRRPDPGGKLQPLAFPLSDLVQGLPHVADEGVEIAAANGLHSWVVKAHLSSVASIFLAKVVQHRLLVAHELGAADEAQAGAVDGDLGGTRVFSGAVRLQLGNLPRRKRHQLDVREVGPFRQQSVQFAEL